MGNSRSHKYRRPVAHHCVPRKALLSRLDRVPETPVAAVLAPPGYGKTTLVSNYIESSEKLPIWYCVDEGDADLATFFINFSDAVRKATPSRRKVIVNFQALDAMNIKAFARRYFAAVYLRLNEPFLIVFDDIHECVSPLWAEVIRVAIDELSETGQIILISRQALTPEFSRLNLNQKIHYIYEADLRFDNNELKKLALTHNVDALSDEKINQIQQMVTGWVAGLALLFTRMEHADQNTLLALDSQDDLFKYFTNEVLRCIDSDAREILYRTCFLPDVSVKHAVKLTENQAAGETLRDLYNKNYFIYRVTDAALVYRYHPLFKSFLISQSQAELDGSLLRKTQELTVTLLETDGAIVAAASLLIKMDDMQRLSQFVQKYAKTLVSENCTHTLSSWLQEIPAPVIDSSGWLLYWRAICVLYIRPQYAREDFINALNNFQRNSDLAGQCLSLSGILNSYIVERDDFKPLDQWIEQVDQLEPVLDEKIPAAIRSRLTESMFSALLHRAPHHQNFDVWLERLKSINMNELPPNLRANKQIYITLHYLWQGDYYFAEINHTLLAQQIAQSSEVVPRILWHLIQCAFLWMTGSARHALNVAKEGLALAEKYELKLWNIPLLSHAAAAALMTHKNDEAGRLLQAASEYLDKSGRSHLSLYYMLKAIQTYRCGDVEAAIYHTQEAQRFSDVAGSPYYQACANFLLGQSCYLNGDIENSRRYILKTKTLATQMRSHFHEFQSMLLGAIIDWKMGDKQKSLECMKKSLSLGKKHNLLPGLWFCDEAMAELFAEAMRHNIEPDYVCHIIVKRNMVLATAPYDIETWPWPIRIFTLGRFEVLIKGQPLTLPSRNRPKVFALLKVLIAFGGKKVREELISEVIWPDAEGDTSHQLFTTTLFRLRKMLGHHDALINREGLLSINEKLCWLDTWAFNENSEKLASLLNRKSDDIYSIKSYHDRLCNYYEGDFFQKEDGLLVVAHKQQKMRSKWIHSLFLLANYWLEIDDRVGFDSCIGIILNVNPLEEKAYRMRIDLYLSEGRLSEAAATYEICKKSLQLGLDVIPSIETEIMHKKIQNFEKV